MATHAQSQANIQRLLLQPRDSTEIGAALGVTQSTVSRLLSKMPEVVAFGAARARKYALARDLPGVDQPIPFAEVSREGELHACGSLYVLQGGWYAVTRLASNKYTFYQGLPFFLSDIQPQGFLGRAEPLRHADLELPRDIQQWSPEHFLKYVSRRGENAPGNLVLGNESQARFLYERCKQRDVVIIERERAARYPPLAQAAMRGDPPGSSAGGEQPKFTAIVGRDIRHEINDHVIVKFSPPIDSASGRRWADLLVCELLALRVLAANGIAAARTDILESEGRVFLEVVRFDRVGMFGRSPMVTFSALDGDLGMADQSWSAVAQTLHVQNQLPAEDVRTVEILDLYGALIGNEDKHHGNIAVSWTFDERFRLLPCYDMLPMLYRPNTHGEIMQREWSLGSIKKLQLVHLPLCFRMAQEFWNQVLDDARISADFKQLAGRHVAAIEAVNPKV